MQKSVGGLAAQDFLRLLGEFLVGAERAGQDRAWLADLSGECLAVDLGIAASGAAVQVIGVTFLADGVRQVAPSTPFDPVACARALVGALHREGQTRKGGQKT